jgi:hypothetical protein
VQQEPGNGKIPRPYLEKLIINVENGNRKLRVKCIKCGEEWEKDTVIPWGPDEYTSSLCNPCFRELISQVIHRKQLKEGNFDCFGKAAVFCDQSACKYRELCLPQEKRQGNG